MITKISSRSMGTLYKNHKGILDYNTSIELFVLLNYGTSIESFVLLNCFFAASAFSGGSGNPDARIM